MTPLMIEELRNAMTDYGCDPEAFAELEADAQALADVRTLDAWARANPDDTLTPRYRGYPDASPEEQWEIYVGNDEWGLFATPDAARSAAAVWVREQAKGAP